MSDTVPPTEEYAAAQDQDLDVGHVVAPPEDEEPVVRYFKTVEPEAELVDFQPMEKIGNLYVVKLSKPLLVQTPPLTLASPLDDDDGTPLSHAHLALPRAFAAFAQRIEQRVLEACLANKEAWFRRQLNDASLRASFKEFCRPAGLKVLLPRDALLFDESGTLVSREDVAPGASMRCLLELSRICFGRTEFGAMWSLLQAQTVQPQAAVPPPRCMIDPTVDDEPDHKVPMQSVPHEAHEFL